MITKKCSRCKQIKPISEFYSDRARPDGVAGRCKVCARLESKEYGNTHKEWRSDSYKTWLESHREERKQYCKDWHSRHKEEDKVVTRTWKITHKEKHAEHARKYRVLHVGKVDEQSRRARARKSTAPGRGITDEQWEELKASYGYRCAYCGNPRELTLDHIVPLSKGGLHDIINAVPACHACNSGKKDRSLLMFLYKRITESFIYAQVHQ